MILEESQIKKYFNLNKSGVYEPSDLFIFKLKKHIFSEKRFNHSLSVGKLCYDVALSNNLDNPLDYYFLGLVHDIAKELPKNIAFDMMNKYFKPFINFALPTYHAFLGQILVIEEFSLCNKDLLDAIKYHCTGNSGLTSYGMIVYACDKIDPLRDYDSSNLILAMKEDYIKGFKKVLKENILFLKQESSSKNDNFYLNKYTEACIKEYLM